MPGCCFVSTPPGKAVYRAAKGGQEQKLRALIQQLGSLPDLLEWKDSLGRTPLIVAAENGFEVCVQLLLESGANVHHQSVTREGGGNALHGAVYRRQPIQIIEMLLVFGSDPLTKNQAGLSAMDYAISRWSNDTARRCCEKYGFFSGFLEVQVFSREWQRFWVEVLPRQANNQQHRPGILLMYSDRCSEQADLCIYLEGGTACLENDLGTCSLILNHNTNAFVSDRLHVLHLANGDVKVTLRPCHPSGSAELLAFSKIINTPQLPAVRQLYTDIEAGSNRSLPFVIPFDENNAQARSGTSDYISEMIQNLQGAFEAESNFNLAELMQDPHVPSDCESDIGFTGIAATLNFGFRERPNSGTNCPTMSPSTCTDDLSMYSNATLSSSANISDVTSNVDECVEVNELALPVETSPDDDLCVICLHKKRAAGFFHGTSVHRCCCLDCAKDLMENSNERKCPICRQEIERIVECVYL